MIKAFLAKQSVGGSDTGINSKVSTVKTTQHSSTKGTKAATVADKSNPQDSKTQEPDVDVETLADSTKDNEGLIMDESSVKSDKPENVADVDTGNELNKFYLV